MDNVRAIDSGPVDFDVDARQSKTYPPYRLRMDGQTWLVQPPDVGTVMQAEKSPTTEAFMQIMFEDDWKDLEPIFKSYPDPELIFEVARAISRHFNLDAAAVSQQPMNRRERRAQPRR